MKSLITLAAFLCSTTVIFGLQILAILPVTLKSHLIVGNSVVESLLDAGHNLTVISSSKDVKESSNYRVVPIPDILEGKERNIFNYLRIPVAFFVLMLPKFAAEMVNSVMRSEELDNFLKSDEKFDVCVMELLALEALLGIPEKFDCALVYYSALDLTFWVDTVTGNNSPASFVPNLFLWFDDDMTLMERMTNTLMGMLETVVHWILHMPYQKYLYKKYFPNAKKSFNEMYKNSSLIFVNNHVSSSFVRPRLPTQIEIGGIHIKNPKPLPSNLQTILDDATDGAILFSMGSCIDGTDWSVEQREIFLKVFGKLKQKVLWGYSNDTLPGNPGNIFISSWFPQRDILAHPNVKVFITHGGLLGTFEAIVERVPVLGIPIFGDQKMNMAKTVARGCGLQISFNDISEKLLTESINELLNNPMYKKKTTEISRRFNDRPRSPQQEVVFWTEYVARHLGAAHLQAQSVNMSYIQFYSFDVYFIIISVLLVALYIEYKIIKIILKKIFKNKTIKKKKA